MEKNILFLFIAILFLANQEGYAQWVQTNGPEGGFCHIIATNGNNIFANVSDNFLLSTDNGFNWNLINNGLPDTIRVNTIAFNGDSIFIGIDKSGIFLSTDNGSNWIEINNGLTNLNIRKIIVSNGKIFAGAENGDVFTLSDNGANWSIIGQAGLALSTMIVKDNYIFIGTRYGVYKMDVSDSNWSETNNGLTNLNISSMIKKDNVIYIGTWGGIFKSTDNGANWTAFNNGMGFYYGYERNLYVLGNNIYAGTDEGIFVTGDNAANWNKIGLTDYIVLSIAANGNNLFAGTYGGGIFLSTDNGENWEPVNKNLGYSDIWRMTSDEQKIVAGSYFNGVYISSDNGDSWENISTGLPNVQINDIILSNGNIIAALLHDSCYISINNGENWSAIVDKYVDALAQKDSFVYASNSANIKISKDYGLTWGDYIRTTGAFESIAIGKDYIFGAERGGVYRSHDNGKTWENNFSSILKNVESLSMVTKNDSVLLGTWSGRLFRSIDSATTWEEINYPVLKKHWFSTLKNIGDTVFMSVYGAGVFVSTDFGRNWKEINEGLRSLDVESLTIHNGYLFVGTESNSVWRRPLSEIITDVKKIENSLPVNYSLEQNYPNPFNPTTTINYSIPAVTVGDENFRPVQLKVYDVLGREVATLVNKKQYPGFYKVTFDASNLSSGIYFYKLQTGNFVETKKMILLR